MSTTTDLLTAAIPYAGLVTSVVGNIVGGIETADINKKRQANLDTQAAYNQNLFNKDYYQDTLKRSENQSYLRELDKRLKDQNLKAKRTAAITGATPEAALASQSVTANAYADTVNKMAGAASTRKDQALARYNQSRLSQFGMQDQLDQQKAAQWSEFMQNANQLGGSALGMTAKAKKGDDAATDLTKKIAGGTSIIAGGTSIIDSIA